MSADIVALAVLALVVGWAMGATGIGGVLLIPALAWVAALHTREAMATALFTFIFTGIAGTLAFARADLLSLRNAAYPCIAAALGAAGGSYANAASSTLALNAALAAIMIGVGTYASLSPARRANPDGMTIASNRGTLVAIGAVSGFAAGLTGVGGPALAIPLMLLAGVPALGAVAISQPLQVFAAAVGTLGNLAQGTVMFSLGVPLAALQIVGVMLGNRHARRASAGALRRLVAGLCIAAGVVVLLQALAH